MKSNLPDRLTLEQLMKLTKLINIGIENAPSKELHMYTGVNPKDLVEIMGGK